MSQAEQLIVKYRFHEVTDDSSELITALERCTMEQTRCLWTDIQLSIEDCEQYQKMTEDVRRVFDTVMAFFYVADGIVQHYIDDLPISSRVLEMDAQQHDVLSLWYKIQNFIEEIHNRTYSRLTAHLYGGEKKALAYMAHVFETSPILTRKIKWICEKVLTKLSAAKSSNLSPIAIHKEGLILRFILVCMEGILFMGSFSFLFWLYDNSNIRIKAVQEANLYIARDEYLHVRAGGIVFQIFRDRFQRQCLSKDEYETTMKEITSICHDMVTTLLEVEVATFNDAMFTHFNGFNLTLLTKNLKHLANYTLEQCGLDLIPFGEDETKEFTFFSHLLAHDVKTNFFEVRNTHYQNI